MTRRFMPAVRWTAPGYPCIGCGRSLLMPHTSHCDELAKILKRAKEDNIMVDKTVFAEFTSCEKTGDGGIAVDFAADLVPVQGLADSWSETRRQKLAEAFAKSLPSPPHLMEQLGEYQERLAQAFGMDSPFAESLARQRMLMLGSGAAQAKANAAAADPMTMHQQHLRQAEDAEYRRARRRITHLEEQVAVKDRQLDCYAKTLDVKNQHLDVMANRIIKSERMIDAGNAKIAALERAILALDDEIHDIIEERDALLARAPAAEPAPLAKTEAVGRAIGTIHRGWTPVV